MKKGKVFVIDSRSDGSGKATQTELLHDRLSKEGYTVRKVDYPNYKSESSSLVKMYLKGAFGLDPGSVNPYMASTFYAVDRCASFHADWKDFYESGGIILADRYTTSNMIHQAVKIEDTKERKAYLDWLYDLEYIKCQLPIPDQVFLLDVPVDVSFELMRNRLNKIDNSESKDIHESNFEYLRKCYDNASEIANHYGWTRIACTESIVMRSIESIHEEIYKNLIPHLL
ncbi:dTMP kinase [Brevibacillus sp. NPDC058079]|uniref:dTMP kinase n=1 Tax=Brevibacillus sp. NPDC058079 TaxID=3346330 RepID=UPI0036EECB48